jgi:predicted DsbA family dithiol-disulfide isomerase
MDSGARVDAAPPARGAPRAVPLAYFARLALAAVLATGCIASGAERPREVDRAAVGYEEGSPDARVHVIMFDDYACPDCAQFNHDAIGPLMALWVRPGRARLTLVDLAWKRGSVAGATAAWCAKEQGKFWPMHALLFQRQASWTREVDIPAQLVSYAAELGLDTTRFQACTSWKAHRDRLAAAEDEARRFGVRGTPAFVVNGRPFYGAHDWSWMEQVLLDYERGVPDSAPPPPLAMPAR